MQLYPMLISVKLGLLFLFFMSMTKIASTRQCPLGLKDGKCDEFAVCAIFDGNSAICTGWSTYRCARSQYRDMNTCMCINCPRGTGFSCDEQNECCSLDECKPDPTPASTTKPRALSPACLRAPQVALSMLLTVSLTLMRLHTQA